MISGGERSDEATKFGEASFSWLWGFHSVGFKGEVLLGVHCRRAEVPEGGLADSIG